ncbi:MAG: type II toxin-antitoxin system HicA family toxin [Thermoanaerobaculia bacterium]
MKRTRLERHLLDHGCQFHREGARHEVWIHVANQKISTVPRHPEIKKWLVLKICKGSRDTTTS